MFTYAANISNAWKPLKNYLAFLQHSNVTSLIITTKSGQSLAKGQLYPLCNNQIPISLITETNDTLSPR